MLAGLAVTGLHVCVASTLIGMGWLPALANGAAFAIATMASYLVNTIWSFSAPIRGRNLWRFVQVSVIGFTLSMLISGLADYCHLHYYWGIALVAIFLPPITFFLHLKWTYK